MKDFSTALIWLGFFASIFLGWYFYLKARNKERMALIEKNADVSEIFKAQEFKFPWFKIGMMIAGIGLGLLFTYILPIMSNKFHTEANLAITMMLLFGGLSIVIAYYLERNTDR